MVRIVFHYYTCIIRVQNSSLLVWEGDNFVLKFRHGIEGKRVHIVLWDKFAVVVPTPISVVRNPLDVIRLGFPSSTFSMSDR